MQINLKNRKVYGVSSTKMKLPALPIKKNQKQNIVNYEITYGVRLNFNSVKLFFMFMDM